MSSVYFPEKVGTVNVCFTLMHQQFYLHFMYSESRFLLDQLVLNSFMIEREKAQQENNSALERSQILAKEVISLEEKVNS